MKKYFNTEEKALAHLEYRKKCAHERILKSGDKILGDASCVLYLASKGLGVYDGKWVVFVQIITKKLIEDLMAFKSFDSDEEFRALIPFSESEKIVRKEKKIRKIERKYKTLDIENYTINKK